MCSKYVVLCWAVTCVFAAPAPTDVVPLEKQQPTVIPIVSQSDELESNGTYKFSYETGNGIKREETAYDKVIPKVKGRSAASSNEGGESDESDEIHVQQGSYSYTAPDGTLISVRYIADENGFRPVGDHIPQSIVAAAAAAGSSSGEKLGRALKADDSAHSASAPAGVSTSVLAAAFKSESPKKVEAKKTEAAPKSAPVELSEAAPSTEAAKSTEASGETTENASEASSPSTTESASTANASTEASDASEGTTNVTTEATTKAADATTEATSELPDAPSSTSADASTTEAASNTST